MIVITANGAVHTNEEAQVNVHDLSLFATVQLLEETPAVLSVGKLCDDHGHSHEWVSGQKPRLTKEDANLLSFQGSPVLVAIRHEHDIEDLS